MDFVNKILRIVIDFGVKKPIILAAAASVLTSLLILLIIPQLNLFKIAYVLVVVSLTYAGLIYVLVQSMSSKLSAISYVMDRLKSKDFGKVENMQELSGLDSFADSYNNMVTDLRSLITYLKEISRKLVDTSNMLSDNQTKVTQAIDDISDTMTEIAQGASEQASEAEKGVSRITGLTEQINKVSLNAQRVIDDSNIMRDLSTKGITAVEVLKKTSDESKSASGQTMSFIVSFIDKTKNIGEFVGTINSIAEQTNLLALNAAIEAARAGDAGRGFAVVADEVRKLADASKKATERVEDIMTGILSDADKATSLINSIRGVVDDQNLAVENTNVTFKSIAESIEKIVKNINKVGQAIQEMEKSKASAIEAIQNISAVTEEAAASSEEVASNTIEQKHLINQMTSSAKDLNELSLTLRKFVDTFKV